MLEANTLKYGLKESGNHKFNNNEMINYLLITPRDTCLILELVKIINHFLKLIIIRINQAAFSQLEKKNKNYPLQNIINLSSPTN